MGNVRSSVKGGAIRLYEKSANVWDFYLHPLFHYGAVPLIFAVGLAAAGELTLNPVSLFNMIIIS